MIQTSLHPLDVAIIALYLAMLAAVGLYFSKRQKNLDEFFLAKQSMAWLPVGLSLMAALDSAIDYLMQPSITIRYGLIMLIGTSSDFPVSMGRESDAAVLPRELLHCVIPEARFDGARWRQ